VSYTDGKIPSVKLLNLVVLHLCKFGLKIFIKRKYKRILNKLMYDFTRK
jgi:hypothetical protein